MFNSCITKVIEEQERGSDDGFQLIEIPRSFIESLAIHKSVIKELLACYTALAFRDIEFTCCA